MLAAKHHSRAAGKKLWHHGTTASYASVRNVRRNTDAESEENQNDNNDFIMSILRAKPSLRDSKNYLASFGAGAKPHSNHNIQNQQQQPFTIDPFELPASRSKSYPTTSQTSTPLDLQNAQQLQEQVSTTPVAPSPVLQSILEPIVRRTALVKMQGPFTDRQLASVAQGMVYLEKLGLVSVIIVDAHPPSPSSSHHHSDPDGRQAAIDLTNRITLALESQGARARPIIHPIVRLGPKKGEENLKDALEAHVDVEAGDLVPIRAALRAGEIPVLVPFAVDSGVRSLRVDASDVVSALARGMVEAGSAPFTSDSQQNKYGHDRQHGHTQEIDLTPLRLMIISREGGIPSYARSGLPHLLINLSSEHTHIRRTFLLKWSLTSPSALPNLTLAKRCLEYMPPEASAIMVSHRSRSSLIANLITNRPAFSSSLPHALLQGSDVGGQGGKLTKDTPTLLRRGLGIRVVNSMRDVDRRKLKDLLEMSFGRKLNERSFFERLEKRLDFVIVAGDYAGAAIVTREPLPPSPSSTSSPSNKSCNTEYLTYLDKFAVLPSHRGSGTVDFLWVALHDESYGLGLPYSVNPNGGKQGRGEASDLIWRSRSENGINGWYFERSSGHLRVPAKGGKKGDWVIFWCDAEGRLKDASERTTTNEEGGRRRAEVSFVEGEERGRVERWCRAVEGIPSAWCD